MEWGGAHETLPLNSELSVDNEQIMGDREVYRLVVYSLVSSPGFDGAFQTQSDMDGST